MALNTGSIRDVAGVDPETGLASDYLNHFYEPLMLLEHVCDDPDLLDDLAAWSPSSYSCHFGESQRPDRQSVLSAYHEMPQHLRQRLDSVVDEAGQATALALDGLLHTARQGGNITQLSSSLTEMLRRYIRILDSIIHGRE